jgi:hypothetical protein
MHSCIHNSAAFTDAEQACPPPATLAHTMQIHELVPTGNGNHVYDMGGQTEFAHGCHSSFFR